MNSVWLELVILARWQSRKPYLLFLHRITDLTMILVAKYLERKCRTQSKKSVWSRGTQTESSHIYLGRRSNLLRSVFPSNHLSSAPRRLPQPMISPIVGKVRLEGAFGLSRHTPLGLFLSHLIPNTEQSTVPNPLQQKGTKERGGHPPYCHCYSVREGKST